MLGLDGSRLIRQLLRLVDVLRQQLLLGGGEQLVDHLLEATACAGVIRIAAQRLAVQVGRVLFRWGHVRARSERLVGTRQQTLQHFIAARCALCRLRRSSHRCARRLRNIGFAQNEPHCQQSEGPECGPAANEDCWRKSRPRVLNHGRRGHRVHAAGVLLPVTAPCRLDEQPDALFGYGLMQEPVDRAVRDLGCERALVVDSAGDDEHEIRELSLEAVRELFDGAADRGRVEYGDSGVLGDQLGRQIGLGAHGEYVVIVAENLQRLNQRAIVAEHDQALASHRQWPWKGAHNRSVSRIMYA